MRLKQLSRSEVASLMSRGGVNIDLGIASFNVQSSLPAVCQNFYRLYQDHKIVDPEKALDFHVKVNSSASLRKWLLPQIEFICDQHSPFLPLPKSQAYPVLEWGMNWCIASHCHNYLLLHAAVLAKGEQAIVFPAPPGSGKSTLTGYLAHSGWRLLSDEMAVIDTSTNRVHPFIRPICLKNNSIDLIREWFPDTIISDVARDTNKGDVAHVKPPVDSLNNMYKSAEVKAVVFPKYNADVQLDIYQLDKCDAFLSLAENGFNNNVLARSAFLSLTSIVENANNYEMVYSNKEEMKAFLEDEVRGLN